MAADPRDLCTVAEAKAYLGLTTTADDALIQDMVTAASDWITDYTDQPIKATEHTEYPDGTGNAALPLRFGPVISVSSVTMDGQTVTPATPGGTDAGFLVDAAAGRIVYRNGVWKRGLRNVAVVYTAGYASVPASLRRACAEIVAWRMKERERIGHASKTVGTETVAFQTTDVPANVKTLLTKYRKVTPF